jgi:hypothetical protein
MATRPDCVPDFPLTGCAAYTSGKILLRTPGIEPEP